MEFLEVFGSLEPALTNFMYKNLVLETWYDVKKAFIDDAITRNTASWQKVNLPCSNATLHAPKMWARIGNCFEERKETTLGAICHLYKLDGDGSVSYVAPKQKDSKVCGIANTFFQDRSSLM